LALALQLPLNPLSCLPLCLHRMLHELLLRRDPPVQLRDLTLDHWPPLGDTTGQFTVGIAQQSPKLVEHPGGGTRPRQVFPELRQRTTVATAEVDKLTRSKPKR
jgi:hypothetical protein